MKIKFLIIGAGVTGLGAAYRLNERKEEDYLILEKNSWVGGLAASFLDCKGFTWDIGGHVQFSHYEYFDQAMQRALSPENWLSHQRESWVWLKNRFIPYPFQNNIHFLPINSLWKCLRGLFELSIKKPKQSDNNFEEWILNTFGSGIANEFMLPYNYKVWAYPAKEMSYQWIGERVSVPNVKRIISNLILNKLDTSWGPNNLFKFPLKGGTGAIWESIAQIVGRDKIKTNSEVALIDSNARKVILTSGQEIQYDYLLSTIPLNILSSKVSYFNESKIKNAQLLKYSTSNIVGVGLKGQPSEDLKTKCWMYFPENNCPFYRVTLFSRYSPFNVPEIKSQFSLMTETSESKHKPIKTSELVKKTIEGLKSTRLISSRDEIISLWSYRAEYGYPTPSLERDSILEEIIPALEKLGIYSRGRFGAWKYEVSNQDHSFMQGVEWANLILSNTPEETLKINHR